MSDTGAGKGPDEPWDDALLERAAQEIVADGGAGPVNTDEWQLEVIFRSLTSQRRRYILYKLQDSDVSDIETLATHITAVEQNKSTNEDPSVDIDRRKTQLLHSDLPQLEDAGLIEYDRRSGAVRYSQPPVLLDIILRLCADIDIPDTQSDSRPPHD